MSESRPVALITGAAQGIGKAQALGFARRGYDLGLVDLLDDALAETASAAEQIGVQAATFAGDLTDLEFAERCVVNTADRFGRLDVLSNTAIWREIMPLPGLTVESWEKTVRLGLTTPAFMGKWAAERMIEAGRGGVIINISSIMAVRSNGICPAYVASKGGLDALTHEMAALYGQHGIRVVSVRPGAVNTAISNDYQSGEGENLTRRMQQASFDQTPLGRWAEPEEIADVACWLASSEARFITGTTIDVDGGILRQFSSREMMRLQFPEYFS